MLYPFSLTLDLYIQAESFEEAKKLAEAYVQDASLDTTDYPEIVQDVFEEWEEVDSCWGCYEETDELIKEVMIENGLEE